MFSKRLEKGKYVWPAAADGKVTVSPAQLSMLLEGIDWRAPQRTWRPLTVGNLEANPVQHRIHIAQLPFGYKLGHV